MTGRRVLITGISGVLASGLAARLEARDDVEHIVGLDVREPRVRLRRTEFVRADVRNPIVARILTSGSIDTVAHLAVLPTPGLAGGRARMKELNVIGSMQLLAICQKAETLRKVVVKSSTAIYGSDYTDPAAFTEDITPRVPPKGGYAQDVTEVEGYARTFGRRRPDASVTILRFANFIGASDESIFARYFSLPVIPRVMGFDPRLQFCHEEDALEVLERAVVEDHPGVYNVAGPGVLYLSQAIRRARRVPAPVPLPFVSVAGSVLSRARRIDFSPEQLRFLQFGRIVDVTRLREVFGYEPKYSTAEAFADFLARRRLPPERRGAARDSWERDLQDFMARRGHDRAVAARPAGERSER